MHIEELFGLNPEPYSELDVISTLVHVYEQAHYAIPYPDPIDAIKYLMEENGWKNIDLERFIGPKSSVSEILSRKRYFTLQQINNLHRNLGLPLEGFIHEKTLQITLRNGIKYSPLLHHSK